jgi:hypothetical protein
MSSSTHSWPRKYIEVSGQLHASAALSPGKGPLRGLQSRSGGGGEEENSQVLPEIEPPIFQPVAQRYTTEVSRLLVNKL